MQMQYMHMHTAIVNTINEIVSFIQVIIIVVSVTKLVRLLSVSFSLANSRRCIMHLLHGWKMDVFQRISSRCW